MKGEEKIRVLIADDSFFIRRYIAELLRAEPDIEVVGLATTGDEVVSLAAKLKPDVITMDYNMPGKNGMEAAAAIMLGGRPLPSIIMLSAFEGEEGSTVRHTLEASGARVIAKPSGEVSLDIGVAAKRIITEVREAGTIEMKIRRAYVQAHEHLQGEFSSGNTQEELRAILVIGASTGGPPLVEHLLSALDPQAGIAVVIAQHMSKYFTEIFAERLDRTTRFAVREIASGDVLKPGHAFVVPGGMMLEISDKISSVPVLTLIPMDAPSLGEEEIDRTMSVIARAFKAQCYGVLLSGMGSDGTRGLEAIKSHGGRTIVQDPETATISSMPEHALHGGFVDIVLPIEKIPSYIIARLASRD